MTDYISRADAIEAVCRTRCGDKAKGCPAHSCLVIEEFDALPSADAEQQIVPTVVRVTMSDGSQYYLEHERDAIQADAVQGEWKIDEYGIYHCPFCYAINNTVYKSFCPNCGARMKGGEE